MLGVAYTAVLSIKVESVPALGLGECPRGTFTSRGGVKQLDRLRRGGRAAYVPLCEPCGQIRCVHAVNIAMQQARTVQFT
ncbi:Uncharacterised protein [Mycobacteroides abscessus subsp. abscessus]|nr:Uncharacterised protein [Mycobacteroides abscessus subsp. abscessus]